MSENHINRDNILFTKLYHYLLNNDLFNYEKAFDIDTVKLVNYLYDLKKRLFIPNKFIKDILYDELYNDFKNNTYESKNIHTFNIKL